VGGCGFVFFGVIQQTVFEQSWLEDIRDKEKVKEVIMVSQPDVIFHMAAQPLVIDSYRDPIYTFDVNVMGTAVLLEGLKCLTNQCAVVIITTDKVYENLEWEYPYRENDRLGGHDPYSSSKACAELVVQSYRKSFFPPNKFREHKISLATVRAGNVIGGGDWSTNRIIPDIVRAFHGNSVLEVRNPASVRPWQHVLDAIYGYLVLTERLVTEPGNLRWQTAWNFGPVATDNLTVKEIIHLAADLWHGGQVKFNEPDKDALHEAELLRLDCSKAHQQLNWTPVWNAGTAIAETIKWYQTVLVKKQEPAATALAQIRSFLATANKL
jgi:CDP-glucose 4,6-dehydratase